MLNALNNNLLIGGIFCDLQKAVDCIYHKILLSKLEFCGLAVTRDKLYKHFFLNLFLHSYRASWFVGEYKSLIYTNPI